MAGSITKQQPPQIATTASNKELIANGDLNAASPAMFGALDVTYLSGLTWGLIGGWYGGVYISGSNDSAPPAGQGWGTGTPVLTLPASSTVYVYFNPNYSSSTPTFGYSTAVPTSPLLTLYQVVTGASSVLSWVDMRQIYGVGGGGGGSGTVTSIALAGGLEAPGGSPITTTGTVRETMLLAGGAVATAAYTFVTGDRGTTLVMNSATAVAQALPTPTGTTLTTNFPKGWFVSVENIGAGTTTVSAPTGVDLDGVTAGSIALATNTGCLFFTDGTNYYSVRGAATGGGGGSSTLSGLSDVNVTEGAGIDQNALIWNNATTKWIAKSFNTAPVAIEAANTSGQSIPNGAYTTITNWTNVQDSSSGAWVPSTGVFTAAATGWFMVSVSILLSQATFASGALVGLGIQVNGSIVARDLYTIQAAGTFNQGAACAALLYLTAGNTVAFQVYQSSGAAVALASPAGSNTMGIVGVMPPGVATAPQQSVTTYTAAHTVVTNDINNVIVMNSATAVAQALPTPTGTTGNFPNGWNTNFINIGAGIETLSVPSGVYLDGVLNGTLALSQFNGVRAYTDGTNWFTKRGTGSADVWRNITVWQGYYTPLAPFLGDTISISSGTPSTGFFYLMPIVVHRPMTIQPNMYVTAAGSGESAIVGLYSADPTTGLPSALLHQFSTMSLATVGMVTSTDTYSVAQPGTYWVLLETSATSASLRALASSTNLTGMPTVTGFPAATLTSGVASAGAFTVTATFTTTLPASLSGSTFTDTYTTYKVFFTVTNQG